MHKTIISDTSCLIVLTNIDELKLLRVVYGHVITTPQVAAEYTVRLPEWISIVEPCDKARQQILELQIDVGEASAIALALETPNCTLIVDDYKARRIAEQLRLEITGTLGVIIKAKQKGLIPSVRPYIEKLKNADFRMAITLEKEILLLAGEE